MNIKTHPIYKSPKWNEDVFGSSPQCVSCGRVIKNPRHMIHATTDWVAVNTKDHTSIPNSQGFFDIGSECLKHFPKDFIFRTND
jgi:hypothetical protein